MPNRFQRNSIGELVCRVPLQRGSLLKSIENLVKTIETSENAVMIPTLLRDKVRVDAWELLFVAKILKASILGHDDLVEFYMNHIHQNGLSTTNGGGAPGAQSAAQTPGAPPNGQLTPNGLGSPALSPSLLRQQSSPASMASPLLTSHPAAPLKEEPSAASHVASSTSSSASSQTSQSNSTATITTTTTTTANVQSSQTGQVATSTKSSSSSAASWATAPNGQSNSQQTSSMASSSAFNSAASSLTGAASDSVGLEAMSSLKLAPDELSAAATTTTTPSQSIPSTPSTIVAQDGGLLAARPLVARLAQPPSLLQLTTTNNHINSVSELLNSSPLDPSLDLLSQHLISLQQQQQQQQQQHQQLSSNSNPFEFASGLSLSIPNGAAAGADHVGGSSQAATPTTTRHELRSSRSAGCLFRANSGASSPRTPVTPYPQAETLAGTASQNGLSGDPTSLVKLLLQVEQLKASIVHVNMLLDSVVDLYKKSIDNISQ